MVGQDQVGRLVDHRGLADPGLTDDGQRATLPDCGPGREAGDGVDDVLAAVQGGLGIVSGRCGLGHVERDITGSPRCR